MSKNTVNNHRGIEGVMLCRCVRADQAESIKPCFISVAQGYAPLAWNVPRPLQNAAFNHRCLLPFGKRLEIEVNFAAILFGDLVRVAPGWNSQTMQNCINHGAYTSMIFKSFLRDLDEDAKVLLHENKWGLLAKGTPVKLVSHEHDSKVKFGYSGPTGPDRWADLSPAFSECAKGKSQSPVNILTHSNAIVHTKYKPLLIHYAKSVNSTLINYGFNVGIRYGAEAGMIVLDGKNYTLKQMHWHAPSEHRIDGVQFAAELHLVHFAVADHTLAVIAVLFQLGHRPDPTLAKCPQTRENDDSDS
nr:alpha carbonic anhydrase 1, chloroplastic [Ipomoea batatas]